MILWTKYIKGLMFPLFGGFMLQITINNARSVAEMREGGLSAGEVADRVLKDVKCECSECKKEREKG